MTHRTAQGFEPPGESYVPREGDVVRDTRTSRVGRVMGHVEPFCYLRPLKGEWSGRWNPSTWCRPGSLTLCQMNCPRSTPGAEVSESLHPGQWPAPALALLGLLAPGGSATGLPSVGPAPAGLLIIPETPAAQDCTS